MRHSTSPFLRHAIAVALFAGATAAWIRPIVGRLRDAIPGAAAGDNIVFVWNVWWVRYAITHLLSPLSSPLLLYPFGADLTLHTHTLLPALVVSGIENPVVAQNLLIVAHVFLNLACAYLLAWRETRACMPAIVAAMIFGWSPYLAAHLAGHFNLIAAWVLPLTALLACRAIEEPCTSRSVLLGLGLGTAAYIDYYYFIYAGLLTLLLGMASFTSVPRRRSALRHVSATVTIRVLGILALLALAAAAAIALSGGSVWQIGSRTISIRSIRNPIAAAWLCAVLAVLMHLAGTRVVRFDARALWRLRRPAAASIIVLLFVLTPLLAHAAAILRAGTYVSQRYLWRSAPPGIDLMTLVGGNPSSAFYGGTVRPLYETWNVNLTEDVGWLGPGVIVLIVTGLMTATGRRRWLLPLAVFGFWAVGPSLQAAGHATPLWMPAVLLRWIPIVANARIPARAIIVVYLAGAMLAAYGMRQLLLRRRPALAAVLFALVALDFAPAPPPVFALPHPAIVTSMLVDPTPGAVLNVPFGMRDGLGETGRLDPEAMWLQTIHHRPIAGGFVARLPRDIAEHYRQMPGFASLLRLSSGERLSELEIEQDRAGADSLTAEGFRYVLVNRHLATGQLQVYIKGLLPTAPAVEDADYTLYRLDRASHVGMRGGRR